jgi:hypothetical protein
MITSQTSLPSPPYTIPPKHWRAFKSPYPAKRDFFADSGRPSLVLYRTGTMSSILRIMHTHSVASLMALTLTSRGCTTCSSYLPQGPRTQSEAHHHSRRQTSLETTHRAHRPPARTHPPRIIIRQGSGYESLPSKPRPSGVRPNETHMLVMACVRTLMPAPLKPSLCCFLSAVTMEMGFRPAFSASVYGMMSRALSRPSTSDVTHPPNLTQVTIQNAIPKHRRTIILEKA